MRVFVTGVTGQLGHDVTDRLKKQGHIPITTDITGDVDCLIDLTSSSCVREIIELSPDAIIHCAAWTAVDAAEDEENKPKVYAINVTGTQHVAEATRQLDCKLLYLSTDYVFDGQGERPWRPDDKSYAPLCYYGRTKLEGELAVSALTKYFIVRIAWVFGLHGTNFVRTMLRLSETHSEISVVDDQIGSPTSADELAALIPRLEPTQLYGIYHATCEGSVSWAGFAEEIFRHYERPTKVNHVSSAEYKKRNPASADRR